MVIDGFRGSAGPTGDGGGGLPGSILLSQASWHQIKDTVSCEERGGTTAPPPVPLTCIPYYQQHDLAKNPFGVPRAVREPDHENRDGTPLTSSRKIRRPD